MAWAFSTREDFRTWAAHRTVTLNTTATGAGVASDQFDFPLLLRLTSANAAALFEEAASVGADLRFSKVDGTPLDYELSRFDRQARTAIVWVRLDTVRGNSTGQVVRVHWGKPGAGNRSAATGVFGGRNGFASVLHLTAPGRARLLERHAPFPERRYRRRHGQGRFTGKRYRRRVRPRPIPPLQRRSRFAEQRRLHCDRGAVRFHHLPDVLDVGKARYHRPVPAAQGDNRRARRVRRPGRSRSLRLARRFGHGFMEERRGNTGAIAYPPKGSDRHVLYGPEARQWKHVAAVFAPAAVKLFLNGDSVRCVRGPSSLVWSGRYRRLVLGKQGSAGGQKFGGSLCEVRLDTVARTAGWLRLCHANQGRSDLLTAMVPPPLAAVALGADR